MQKAIRIRYGEHEKLIAAEIDCTVDLDPSQKGVHMSRFPELFEEAIEEVVIGEALLIEELAEHIARAHRRAPARAAGRGADPRALPARARDAGHRALDPGDGVADRLAAASQQGDRRIVGVEAIGINACPCAQGLVRERAAERLREAGFDERRRRADPRARPDRDPQPARAGHALRRHDARVNAEELVGIVEGSMSSPIYELLKRPDELFVVEHAHLQPRFVEDSVRVALRDALAAYPELDDGDFLLSRQVNFETIHAHEVIAERYGTPASCAASSRAASPAARHTELTEWLSA